VSQFAERDTIVIEIKNDLTFTKCKYSGHSIGNSKF
jgi:hypothetical protein